MIGTTLSHFNITAKLGAGGMGEVYRAEDTKLGREVAIKVLPEAVASDPERLARFEREAKVLASLNHPHIAAIYSFESGVPHPPEREPDTEGRPGGSQGVLAAEGRKAPWDSPDGPLIHFLVMELAEGEDLAQRLKRGAVPSDQALPIALQIAEALEAAHERGIIHRDLKPGNIKVDAEGNVKVLDFGLAKALNPEAEGCGSTPDALSMSPTLTAQMTGQGVLLGTAAYMSPEQARGQEVDKRSDIWAFGVVLYEMLTGRQLFDGDTVSDALAAILRADIDLDKLPEGTPALVERVLRRCLERDRRQRLHDIADARLDLVESLERPSTDLLAAVDAHPPARAGRERVLGLLAIASVLFSLLLGWLLWRQEAPESTVIRASVMPPEGTRFRTEPNLPGPVVVSPDGSRLAFAAANEDGDFQLWVRELDELEARPLASTEGAAYPFWSPDGEHLAFFAEGKLRKVEASGGPALTLSDALNGKGGTWNRNDEILFAPSHASPIHRVSSAGGPAVAVTEIDYESGENSHRHPRFLPDGRHFLYLARRATTREEPEYNVFVASLEGGERQLIRSSLTQAEFASGHLWYVMEKTLMAQRFSLDRLETVGDPYPVAEDVLAESGAAFGYFSLNDSGVLAYHSGEVASISSALVWRDRNGDRLSDLGDLSPFHDVSLSPDGRQAGVVIEDAKSGVLDLWLYDLERAVKTRVTFSGDDSRTPVWSPDGKRIAYGSSRGGVVSIYVKTLGGTGEEQLLYSHEGEDAYPDSWSRDNRYLVAEVTRGAANFDIWLLELGDEIEAKPLLQSEFTEQHARVSPDGRWLAFTSDESGQPEVYVAAFPEPGLRWQVSLEGGSQPDWRSDGGELFYRDLEDNLLVAEVDGSSDAFRVLSTQLLLALDRRPIDEVWRVHAPAPDGERILVNTAERTGPSTSPPVTVVVNYPRALRQD